MDLEEYHRSVSLLCASCGNDQFEYDDADEDVVQMTCASCNRPYTKDELMAENAANIDGHLEDMKSDLGKALQDDLRNHLRKALRGSKSIKIR